MEAPVIIDREHECASLRRLLSSGRPHMALLTGRRRIGKTFLLTNAFAGQKMFLFTASRTTAEVNRRQMVQDLAAWAGEGYRPDDYPTWRTLFNLLLEVKAPEPVVIVLDEFQYLGETEEAAAELASELNAAWEKKRPRRPFLMVLSGSMIGTMEALAAGGGPLYGRFSWQHRLQPFNYWNAGLLAPFEDPRDRIRAYGVFGGTPRYLAALDPALPFADNVVRTMLEPGGEVRLLIETAIEQEDGLREVPKYRAILRVISEGCTGRNEIAQRAGFANDQSLRDKLMKLVELGYVEKQVNFDAKQNAPVRYQLADSGLCFHQVFVEPSISLLERYSASQVWDQNVAPHLDTYLGHEFERVAYQAYDRRAEALGLPLIKRWGKWEGTDRLQRSLEIDLVASTVEGHCLTGAVKWNHKPLSPDVHFEHLDMLRRLSEAGRKWAHKALEPEAILFYVAAGGFTDDFVTAARMAHPRVILWTLDDIQAS